MDVYTNEVTAEGSARRIGDPRTATHPTAVAPERRDPASPAWSQAFAAWVARRARAGHAFMDHMPAQL